jgi:hypothetical protein
MGIYMLSGSIEALTDLSNSDNSSGTVALTSIVDRATAYPKSPTEKSDN